MISLRDVERQLEGYTAQPMPDRDDASRAAVACILREEGTTEVLLIRRTEVPGDPWSGHMAFPGGRMEPEDERLLDTAVRETCEEVGVDLSRQAKLLGRLDDLQAMAKGQPVDLVVRPFVFWLCDSRRLTLNEEVAEAFWAPLAPLVSGAADTVRPYRFGEQTLDLPAYQVGRHVVWGLTYRMLRSLFAVTSGD
ncbi:MAG: CoA pyrophosphatase [Deltaproteobacteria bacterium]|jgi:8-oxo-dGTP pyrophosphatase MutT (NUDIX family)|nr:CoA pyrophosphatase [Deltaproteobacteria bacterium]MBW2531553.1 CoA pyrophosphatase [Deltaproteobacteria bacterium]